MNEFCETLKEIFITIGKVIGGAIGIVLAVVVGFTLGVFKWVLRFGIIAVAVYLVYMLFKMAVG